MEYAPGEKRYVGEPSDEIDEAWNELTTSESVISEQKRGMTHGSNLDDSRPFLTSRGMFSRTVLPALGRRSKSAVRARIYPLLEQGVGRLRR